MEDSLSPTSGTKEADMQCWLTKPELNELIKRHKLPIGHVTDDIGGLFAILLFSICFDGVV